MGPHSLQKNGTFLLPMQLQLFPIRHVEMLWTHIFSDNKKIPVVALLKSLTVDDVAAHRPSFPFCSFRVAMICFNSTDLPVPAFTQILVRKLWNRTLLVKLFTQWKSHKLEYHAIQQ